MKLSILLGVALVATLASVSAKVSPLDSEINCTMEGENISYNVINDCEYFICKTEKQPVGTQLRIKQTCTKCYSETCSQGNGNGGSSTSEPTTVTEPPTTEVLTTEALTTVTEPPTTEVLTTEAPTTVTEPSTTEESIPELTPPESGGDLMQPTVECVEGFTGYLPIEEDCSKFVYCFQGESRERTCLDDYIYYHPFKACLPGDTVLCQLYSVGR
ncbi:hypothetical protein ZHAS_00017552 [Anopheles sinensis]|uniref:Chitin-binding type-2 domain-containing protein n=1 Tax=Anopheles sinensis TaxID=74873 RepID=A0A084WGV2_ANOSI|nr:hypothetical protein ZHAS_00017552 [Anopheles sinensis]